MAKGKKTGGRQKGTLNKATMDAREFCTAIIDDPAYRASLRDRAIAGKLAPGVESLLWAYAKGRPTEQIDLKVDNDLVARLEAGRRRAAERNRLPRESGSATRDAETHGSDTPMEGPASGAGNASAKVV